MLKASSLLAAASSTMSFDVRAQAFLVWLWEWEYFWLCYFACKVSCTVIIVEHCVPNLFPRFRHFPTCHMYVDINIMINKKKFPSYQQSYQNPSFLYKTAQLYCHVALYAISTNPFSLPPCTNSLSVYPTRLINLFPSSTPVHSPSWMMRHQSREVSGWFPPRTPRESNMRLNKFSPPVGSGAILYSSDQLFAHVTI